MYKLLLAAGALLVLGLLQGVNASSIAVSQTVTPGGLTLQTTTPGIVMTPVSSDVENNYASSTLMPSVEVLDNRGSSAGWSVTASSTDFVRVGSNGMPIGGIINAANLSITNSAVSTLIGLSNGVASVPYQQFLSAGNSITLMTASSGNGAGKYTFDPTLHLVIPAGTPTGTYVATITTTIN